MDKNLEKLIKDSLKISDRELTIKDMKDIFSINAGEISVDSLEGLQYCRNLQFLYVEQGKISDLSPISLLHKLEYIQLHNCNVRDLTTLSGLVNLKCLDCKNFKLNRCDSIM